MNKLRKRIASIITAAAVAFSAVTLPDMGFLPGLTAPASAENPKEINRLVKLREAFQNGGDYKLMGDITTDSCLTVASGKRVTLDLNGFTIDRGLESATASGLVIDVRGTLTVKDSKSTGMITGGNNTSNSGGIFVHSSANFTLESGTISGNETAMEGGGVFNQGTFIMCGGSIQGNTAATNGGGVCNQGTFTMSGGTISGNTANGSSSLGGGVYNSLGTFTMIGGSIQGNTATDCGGGVYNNQGTFNIYGCPVITNNKLLNETASNVEYAAPTVKGALDDGASICVKGSSGDAVAVAGENYTLTESDAAKFHSDDDSLVVDLDKTNNYMYLGYPITVSDSIENGTVTADKTVAAANDTVTLTVTPDEGYAVKSVKYNDTEITPVNGVYSFEMPAEDVTVTAVFGHTVAIDNNITNGTVSADLPVAENNEAVTLTVTPAAGYAVKSVKVGNTEIEPVNGVYSFTMLDNDVTVTAEFEAIDYNISITAPTNGSITAKIGDTSALTAHYGDTVTLDVTPDTGYSVKNVKVGNTVIEPVEGVYSFTMLDNDVTVTAEFEAIDYSFTALQNLINATENNGTLVLGRDYTALSNESYITIPEGKTITLDLNGHTIDRGLSTKTGDGYVIMVYGNLTLKDSSDNSETEEYDGTGKITGGNNSYQYGGGVYVYDGTFTMTGGTISGNTAYYGSGVSVAGGTFTMTGGTISGNTGKGVYVLNGTFTMTGGTISGNTANVCGGGVYVYTNGTFTMTGGTISGNTAVDGDDYDPAVGGGVYVYGTFIMTGGTISGNTAESEGGGVYVDEGGTFYLKNGVTVSGDVDGQGTIKHFGTVTITETTGGTVTATAADEDKLTVGETTYYVEGGDVTLTVEPASGYALSSLTVKDADNNDITVTNDQFTMPASNVTVTAEFEEIPGTVSVTYIGADGKSATAKALQLTGNEVPDDKGIINLPGGWYVVTDTVNYASPLNFVPSDVHIILCDGASLNIGTADNHVKTYGIACFHSDELKGHLSVYGQSGGTGALNIYSTDGHSIKTKTGFTLNGGKLTTISSYGYGVWSNGGITINGGKLTTTMTNSLRAEVDITINGGTIDAGDIYAYGNITINGGTIDAGNIYAGEDFYSPKTITLGWTKATDSIKAASFDAKYVTFAKPFVIENGTLATEDNIAGHTLTPAKYAVAVTPVDTSGNAVAVQGSWLDSYLSGTSVTLTAPAKEGYNFVGWYAYSTTSPFYTGDALSTNNVYTFTITADTSLAAVYQPLGKVSLTIDGGSSFTINGDAKSTSITADYTLGTSITAATNTAKFAYWKNSYGMVLSRSASYTFTVTGADTITAVFDTVVENKATLVFESAYGQVMAREQLAEGGSMEIPSLPYRNGYTALGWDMNGDGEYNAESDTLAAAITRGLAATNNMVVISPVYELNTATYTIEVVNGTGGGTYNQNDKVTVTANAAPDGQKFSHWTDGTSILSYNASYQFFADRDLALTAVFVEDTAIVDAKGTTEIISTSKDATAKTMTFVSLSSVPNGWTISMAGIIATNDATIANSGDGFNDKTATFVRGHSASANYCRYTWTKSKVDTGDIWYVRAYLVCVDAAGNTHTIYGDMVSQTM